MLHILLQAMNTQLKRVCYFRFFLVFLGSQGSYHPERFLSSLQLVLYNVAAVKHFCRT